MLGFQEILIPLGILVIILLLGSRKFGDLGTGLGQGIKNFRKALKGEESEQGGGDQKGPDKT